MCVRVDNGFFVRWHAIYTPPPLKEINFTIATPSTPLTINNQTHSGGEYKEIYAIAVCCMVIVSISMFSMTAMNIGCDKRDDCNDFTPAYVIGSLSLLGVISMVACCYKKVFCIAEET